jgi:pyruvate,water dikinase
VSERYIYQINRRKIPITVGNKARMLRFLICKKHRVPLTYACVWEAYTSALRDQDKVLNRIHQELSKIIEVEKSYAVRSSANVEDEAEYSYAGQFRTVLGIRGVDDILRAIQEVWASGRHMEASGYGKREGKNADELKMGVLIQEMVSPLYSGVSFSKNPTTGLDDVIVEAVQGTGESLVQEGVTPDRWINKWGDWTVIPERSDAPVEMIGEVVSKTKAIEKDYGKPVDLEWVYDGHTVYWVQMREITSLGGINIYSNKISKEMLPGLIKPLVWTVNVPLVNSVWIRLFTELIGQNDIDVQHLAKPFYYQTYFNMGVIGQIFETLGMPRESLELLMGIESTGPEKPSFKPTLRTFTHLPRMLRMAVNKIRIENKVEKFVPAMLSKYREFQSAKVSKLDEAELMASIDQLYELTQETAYFNIVVPLLMQIYNQLLKSQLSKVGVDFESFDLKQEMPQLQELDPNFYLADLNARYNSLESDLRKRIASGDFPLLERIDEAADLRKGIEEFVEKFGHLSDSGNDFSFVPWREAPDLVIKMIVNFTAPDEKEKKSVLEDLMLPFWKRPLVKWLYRKARLFSLNRERIGSLYTFGYGLFRNYFLALGDRLSDQNIIDNRDDIFYLYLDEVRDAADAKYSAGHTLKNLVNERAKAMTECRDKVLPSIIYGDQPPPVEMKSLDKLKGTPTSRGYYRGPIRVIHGLGEMDKLHRGDILVVPFSDVGWTPLFSKAGAVIAESGGILSHSSIIAREYGIPGVVSVPGACKLEDGTLATVDGYKGEITIHHHEKED